jgi:uncharacterized protein (DUF983 family)
MAKWICSNCGTEDYWDKWYCNTCGKKYSDKRKKMGLAVFVELIMYGIVGIAMDVEKSY